MKRNGFTLIEAIVVLCILGIMASISTTMYHKFLADAELREASVNLYNEMSNLHQIARQYDAKIFVKFFPAQCSLYVDTNNNGIADAGDIKKVIKFSKFISLNVASSGPVTKPADLQTLTGMTGNWSTQMTVKNDAVGTLNDGAVYISSSKLDKTTYCIGIKAPMLSIKQYKWEGMVWAGI